MLSSDVFYDQTDHRWHFKITDLGPLGQNLDTILDRCCRDRKDARRQAAAALRHYRKWAGVVE